MDTIRLLIVDDQTITRSGLQNLLAAQPDLEIVGEARDGEKAVELAETLQLDVILMDLRMPGINGIEATRRIHRASPHIGILILTVFEDDTSVFPAIRAGARGYLLKNTEQDELLRAIRTVASGGAIFSPGIAQKVLGYLHTPLVVETAVVPPGLFDELTTREREILELIAQGKTNSEIADSLSLSPKTISNYISNVLLKVQTTDRAKLMLMALDAGLGQTGKNAL
ncbi:MAG: response regulator transcription factor [Ardenticatenaceae bacterium]|nr:response regulator transcription factor [Ardenticatenaceae bacterium]MCB9446224.1 response regulator transcription factor [Ardenticatenaceae bacterium]